MNSILIDIQTELRTIGGTLNLQEASTTFEGNSVDMHFRTPWGNISTGSVDAEDLEDDRGVEIIKLRLQRDYNALMIEFTISELETKIKRYGVMHDNYKKMELDTTNGIEVDLAKNQAAMAYEEKCNHENILNLIKNRK